jgi:hypothetical protein
MARKLATLAAQQSRMVERQQARLVWQDAILPEGDRMNGGMSAFGT